MYSRKVDDAVLSFGHEGILYRQSFIMYDKGTSSLWVHTTGEAVKGELKGKVLTFLPSTVTLWRKWKALHPETTVLTGKRARGGMGDFNFKRRPNRYGLSIGQGPTPKLYPFSTLTTYVVVNDAHEGKNVVVFYDEDSGTAHAYDRREHTFGWKDGKVVDETGRAWDLLRGIPVKGKARRLQQIPATTWLIDRWRGFHPRAPFYELPPPK